MFVLLFRFVFGGSISTGQPGGYVQLLMPGIFVQTVAFTLAATAVGLAEDMKIGVKPEMGFTCQSCGEEVTVPLTFPGGIKALFIIPDISSELL